MRKTYVEENTFNIRIKHPKHGQYDIPKDSAKTKEEIREWVPRLRAQKWISETTIRDFLRVALGNIDMKETLREVGEMEGSKYSRFVDFYHDAFTQIPENEQLECIAHLLNMTLARIQLGKSKRVDKVKPLTPEIVINPK
jgi:hypothetical protein